MNLTGNQLGWKGYADILKHIQTRPTHAVDLMARVPMTRDTSRRILLRLNELRIIHIVRWEKVPPSKTYMPVYSFGDEQDAPCPGGKPGGSTRKPWVMHNRLPELTHFAGIIRLMREPITLPGMVEETGSSHSNLRALVAYMRKIRLCRVGDWDVQARGAVAMHVLGRGPDKPKPPKQCTKEVNKRYRDNAKARQQTITIIRALAANSDYDSQEAA